MYPVDGHKQPMVIEHELHTARECSENPVMPKVAKAAEITTRATRSVGFVGMGSTLVNWKNRQIPASPRGMDLQSRQELKLEGCAAADAYILFYIPNPLSSGRP